MVYVLDRQEQPLMPTGNHGYVRILLKKKLAKVKYKNPFTVQLLYETGSEIQPVVLGIDPGRDNIGLCAIDESGKPLFAAKCKTRNKEIPKLMSNRKGYRQGHRGYGRRDKRQRRAVANGTVVEGGEIKRHLPMYGEDKFVICKEIKNKEARFCNRRRPDGWLTPTANQLLQTHINLVKLVMKFLPISQVVLELNKFAFMRLDNPAVSGKDFQHGPLYGYNHSVESAVYDLQEGKCLLCGKPIEQFHHVRERYRDGSETIKNRVGLCSCCHTKVHTERDAADELAKKASRLRKQYDALGVLNQIIPELYKQLPTICRTLLTTGWKTWAFREQHGIEKEHHIDAYAIACSILEEPDVKLPEHCYKIMQFRRHDRQACSREMLDRKYLLDGKVVAVNRHKAMDQKADSLEEYVKSGGDTGCLKVRLHPKVMKDMDRPYPGCQVVEGKHVKTILRRSGGYYYFDDGTKVPVKRIRVTLNNRGLVCVSNTEL